MYDAQVVSKAMQVFYYLLQNGELSFDDNKDLYKSYNENENIINLVSMYGDECSCNVERYNGIIYLLPNEENEFIGFSKAELKKVLCRSGATDKDYYLSQFVILSILNTFYNSNGRTSKSRNFIKFGDFMNLIGENLKAAAEYEDVEKLEASSGIAVSNIWDVWEALKGSDTKTISKTTKEGFLRGIIKFLDGQGLLEFIEEDDMIKPTPKLDNFMDWNILNRSNYDNILRAFEEVNITL
ncbi:DUF6063 family protein [Wukongibacter baidiensis]